MRPAASAARYRKNHAVAKGSRVHSIVASAHKHSAAEPIVHPDEQGAFGHSFLPFVFPVVIDANALRDELFGSLAAVGTLNRFGSEETKRQVKSALGAGLATTAQYVGEINDLHAAARSQFESLSPSQPAWATVVAQRDTDAVLRRGVAHLMVAACLAKTSADEVAVERTTA